MQAARQSLRGQDLLAHDADSDIFLAAIVAGPREGESTTAFRMPNALDCRAALERIAGPELASPIRIGKNCWIGGGAVLCPGVTVGENTTVGAGSADTFTLGKRNSCWKTPGTENRPTPSLIRSR